jgi:phosphopantothenoylcysteine decarboxylase/phosphopantothenate--cysteine ligase
MKKTVIVGVSSGIAAYKTLDLVKMLRKEKIEVFVVMTEAARRMVSPKEFEKASSNKVHTDLFGREFDYKDVLKLHKVEHIDLADRADVVVIAPATANVIAKLAHGIADDFLTTMILAVSSPVIIAPSMNVHMWNNPVTRKNIATLKKLGFIILNPERGPLACGYEGLGRLTSLQIIKDEVMRQVAYSKSFTGRKVLITAGATREKIDDVRFITNNSTGKMGAAIAEECHLRGAEVLFLRAKNAVEPRYVIKQEIFNTFDDLEKLLKKYIKDFDVVFHTAAIGDFTVKKPFRGKTKSRDSLQLALVPQKKLSDAIKKLNNKAKLVIFKAEWGVTDELVFQRAKQKLNESRADMVIVNDISRSDTGFEVETNEVWVVTKQAKTQKIPLASKQQIASKIIDIFLTEVY